MTGRLLTSEEIPHFRQIIDNYKPDPQVQETFVGSNFAIIAGPSGAGKDTLRNSLIDSFKDLYAPILSTTTRPPRKNEVDGVDYHFLGVEEMEKQLLNGEFLQSALVHNQQISCLHIDEISKLKSGQTGLSILIVQTETELTANKKDIRTLFIIPPSLDELHRRLGGGSNLSAEEVGRRMEASKFEMITALERNDYYCLVSEDIKDLSVKAHEYFQQGVRESDADLEARTTIRQILNTLSI